MDPALPERSGVPVGARDLLDASTDEVLAWLRARGVPEPGLQDVRALDEGLQGFRRAVLRYGLARALLEKGHALERDEAAWRAFDGAMRARLGG